MRKILFWMVGLGVISSAFADYPRKQQAERQMNRAHAYAEREASEPPQTDSPASENAPKMPEFSGSTVKGAGSEKQLMETLKGLEDRIFSNP